MAQGALAHSNANLAIAITGIAGPQGATEQKPLGMVSFAAVAPKNRIRNSTKYFKGNREQIRTQAVIFALELLLAITNNS